MTITPPVITTEHREQFHRDGFLITPVIFEPEVIEDVKAAFQTVWDELIAKADPDDERQQFLIRERPFISEMHLRQQACEMFLKHPSLLALATQLIGPDVDNNYNQAVIKPPAKTQSNHFSWHQDSFYAAGPHKPKEQLEWDRDILLANRETFQGWVALTPTTVTNGTLVVIPGGHRQGFLPHTYNDDPPEWQAQLDTTGELAVELEPGQMLVFSGLLPHRSGPNLSTDTRMVYQFNYGVPGTRKHATTLPVLRDGVPV